MRWGAITLPTSTWTPPSPRRASSESTAFWSADGAPRRLLAESGYRGSDLEIVEAPEVITMDDPATAAVRRKRNSSIRVAANCVRDGRAEGLVSAGHTGAAMVSAKMVIGTIEGVDRPALAAILPNLSGHCLLLTSARTRTRRPSTSRSSR